jgi:hypothetical protein
MVTVVVRVWMPDRPGALGEVASSIGAVHGDVLGIEILEQGAGRAIDELTVTLQDAELIPSLSAEIDAVDGVSVEDIRIVDDDRVDPNLAALAAGAALAESPVAERLDLLCASVARVIEADWVVTLRGEEPIGRIGEAPDIAWLRAFLTGAGHLEGVDDAAPSDLVWANLIGTGLTIAAGRSERPIHERERVRVSLFARLADALL